MYRWMDTKADKDMLMHWINRTSAHVKMSCQKTLVQHPRLSPYWGTILGHIHSALWNMRPFIVLESVANISGQKHSCSLLECFIVFTWNNVYTSILCLYSWEIQTIYLTESPKWDVPAFEKRHISIVNVNEVNVIYLFLPSQSSFFYTKF